MGIAESTHAPPARKFKVSDEPALDKWTAEMSTRMDVEGALYDVHQTVRSMIGTLQATLIDPVLAIDIGDNQWKGWTRMLYLSPDTETTLRLFATTLQHYNNAVVSDLYTANWYDALSVNSLNETKHFFHELVTAMQYIEGQLSTISDLPEYDQQWFAKIRALAKNSLVEVLWNDMAALSTDDMEMPRICLASLLASDDPSVADDPHNTPNLVSIDDKANTPGEREAHLRRYNTILMAKMSDAVSADAALDLPFQYFAFAYYLTEVCCNACDYWLRRLSGALAYRVLTAAADIPLADSEDYKQYATWLYQFRPAHDPNTGVILRESQLLDYNASQQVGDTGVLIDAEKFRNMHLYSTFSKLTPIAVQKIYDGVTLMPNFASFAARMSDNSDDNEQRGPDQYLTRLCFGNVPEPRQFWLDVLSVTQRNFATYACFSSSLYTTMTHLFLQSHAAQGNAPLVEALLNNAPSGYITPALSIAVKNVAELDKPFRASEKPVNYLAVELVRDLKETPLGRLVLIRDHMAALNPKITEAYQSIREWKDVTTLADHVIGSQRDVGAFSKIFSGDAFTIYSTWIIVWKVSLLIHYFYSGLDRSASIFYIIMTRALTHLTENVSDGQDLCAYLESHDTLRDKQFLDQMIDETALRELDKWIHKQDIVANFADQFVISKLNAQREQESTSEQQRLDASNATIAHTLHRLYHQSMATQTVATYVAYACVGYLHTWSYQDLTAAETQNEQNRQKALGLRLSSLEAWLHNADFFVAEAKKVLKAENKTENEAEDEDEDEDEDEAMPYIYATPHNHEPISVMSLDDRNRLYAASRMLLRHFTVSAGEYPPPHEKLINFRHNPIDTILTRHWVSNANQPSQSAARGVPYDRTIGELVSKDTIKRNVKQYIFSQPSPGSVALAGAIPALANKPYTKLFHVAAPVVWNVWCDRIVMAFRLLDLFLRVYSRRPAIVVAPISTILSLVCRMTSSTTQVPDRIANHVQGMIRNIPDAVNKSTELVNVADYASSTIISEDFMSELTRIWPDWQTHSIIDTETTLGQLFIASQGTFSESQAPHIHEWTLKALAENSILIRESTGLNTIMDWAAFATTGFFGLSWQYNAIREWLETSEAPSGQTVTAKDIVEWRQKLVRRIAYSQAAAENRAGFFQVCAQTFALKTVTLCLTRVPALAEAAAALASLATRLPVLITAGVIAGIIFIFHQYWTADVSKAFSDAIARRAGQQTADAIFLLIRALVIGVTVAIPNLLITAVALHYVGSALGPFFTLAGTVGNIAGTALSWIFIAGNTLLQPIARMMGIVPPEILTLVEAHPYMIVMMLILFAYGVGWRLSDYYRQETTGAKLFTIPRNYKYVPTIAATGMFVLPFISNVFVEYLMKLPAPRFT